MTAKLKEVSVHWRMSNLSFSSLLSPLSTRLVNSIWPMTSSRWSKKTSTWSQSSRRQWNCNRLDCVPVWLCSPDLICFTEEFLHRILCMNWSTWIGLELSPSALTLNPPLSFLLHILLNCILIFQPIQAEARAEFAERSVQKLQKEVDRLEGENFDLTWLSTLT